MYPLEFVLKPKPREDLFACLSTIKELSKHVSKVQL